MTKIMIELYTQINEQITISSAHQEKLRALAIAKMAILNELEQQTEKDMAALLDVYTSIDGERQELHNQRLFEAALKLGMELGSLGA